MGRKKRAGPPQMHAGSMSPAIVDLYGRGVPRAEIARRLGCSPANVSEAIRRHGGAMRVSLELRGREQIEWLRAEAGRNRVSAAEMARALLTDALAEAMEQEAGAP